MPPGDSHLLLFLPLCLPLPLNYGRSVWSTSKSTVEATACDCWSSVVYNIRVSTVCSLLPLTLGEVSFAISQGHWCSPLEKSRRPAAEASCQHPVPTCYPFEWAIWEIITLTPVKSSDAQLIPCLHPQKRSWISDTQWSHLCIVYPPELH